MNKHLFNKVFDILLHFPESVSVQGRTLRVNTKLDSYLDIVALHKVSSICSVEVKGLATGQCQIIAIIPKERILDQTSYDEFLIHYLSQGYKQNQIVAEFAKKGIKPNSQRMVEMKITELKQKYNAKTLYELAVKLAKLEKS